jgi:hypothetical protein
MVEEWRHIAQKDNYEISNMGNVRNVNSGVMLKPVLQGGYFCVHFYNTDHQRKNYLWSSCADTEQPSPGAAHLELVEL